MTIEDRLREIGVYPPAEVKPSPGVIIDFAWARVRGEHVYREQRKSLALYRISI